MDKNVAGHGSPFRTIRSHVVKRIAPTHAVIQPPARRTDQSEAVRSARARSHGHCTAASQGDEGRLRAHQRRSWRLIPQADREYNTAIQYNADFPGGLEAARRLVEDMATRAAQKAREVSNRQLANASEETIERLQRRHLALEAGDRVPEDRPADARRPLWLRDPARVGHPANPERERTAGRRRSAGRSQSCSSVPAASR